MAYSDTGVRGFTVVKEIAESWRMGCLFPYRFRLTVQDGEAEDVYVMELPANEGDATPELPTVNDPADVDELEKEAER